jgi:hypothetical protein
MERLEKYCGTSIRDLWCIKEAMLMILNKIIMLSKVMRMVWQTH